MQYPNLRQYRKIGYDTETTGLQYKVHKVFGFSIATPEEEFYFDIRKNPESVEWLNEEMRDYDGIVCCHNASFDYRMSSYTGIHLPIKQLDDTCIRACLIDEHLFSYSLDDLAKKYLGDEKVGDIYKDLANLFGGLATRNVQMPNLQHAPAELCAPYAKKDARLALDLHDWQDREIVRQGIERIVAYELELMPIFIETEMRGIRVDLDYAERAAEKLTPEINKLQKELNDLAGFAVNVDSPKQVKAMFEPVQLEDDSWVTKDGIPMESTPKGQASVNADFLRSIDDRRAQLVIEVRSVVKTRDTFLGKHVLGHAIGDRVYPTINQSKGEDGGTGTGRLSYAGPAMQQIPSRNKAVAAIVKPCFLPDEGHVWVDCDEASFEVRTFADLINNLEIINAYKENPQLDLHQFVADITGLVRNATYSGQPNAKQLNLSMIFNSGNGAIADKMGMPWEWETFTPRGQSKPVTYKKAGREAMKVINHYHRRLPGIKELAESCSNEAKKNGYIETYFGRRLRFPKGYKAYKASGLKIQATAADWNKENWKMIHEELDGVGHLILNTHDSYSMCLPEDWKPHYERVKNRLQHDGRAKVPLLLDWNGVGHNWWEALQGKEL